MLPFWILKGKDKDSGNIVKYWNDKSVGGGPVSDSYFELKDKPKIESPITAMVNKAKIYGLYHITKL